MSGDDPEVLLRAPYGDPEAARHLVVDQHRAVLRRQLLDTLQVAFGRQLRPHRLHHDPGYLPLVLLQQPLQALQVVLRERYGGPGQSLRYPRRLDTRERELARRRVRQVVGRLVPVVPAVVAAEQDHVAPRRPARDPGRHGASLPAPLRVPHHLCARYGIDEHLGKLDLLGAVQRVDAPLVYLLLHRAVHHVVRVAQYHRPHRVRPVDILVAVHVPEPRPLRALRVDGAHAAGKPARAPADELYAPRYQLRRPVVKLHRLLGSRVHVHLVTPPQPAWAGFVRPNPSLHPQPTPRKPRPTGTPYYLRLRHHPNHIHHANHSSDP